MVLWGDPKARATEGPQHAPACTLSTLRWAPPHPTPCAIHALHPAGTPLPARCLPTPSAIHTPSPAPPHLTTPRHPRPRAVPGLPGATYLGRCPPTNQPFPRLSPALKQQLKISISMLMLTMTRRKFQTSWEVTLERGLYLIRDPGPPAWPSNTGSTCTTGTDCRVPGDWSFRCPVIQACRPVSWRRRGRTLRTRQHSPCPSS